MRPYRHSDIARFQPPASSESNRELGLFGKRITLDENHTHQYVTAIIKVRTRKLIVIDTNGEIIHHADFNLSRELR